MAHVLYSLNKFGAISQYFKEQFSKTNYILCYKQQIETTELNMGQICLCAACACQLLLKGSSNGFIYKGVSNLNVGIDFVNLMCLLSFGISLQNGIHYH